MNFLTLLLALLLLNGILGFPANHTEQEFDEINAIIDEYVDNSVFQNTWASGNTIYAWAKTVHACRKSRGIPTPRQYIKNGVSNLASKDKLAGHFQNEQNTETEKDIPKWEISADDLDREFDSTRFRRYFNSYENPSFKRRIAWLYPDDGLYTSSNLQLQ